MDWDGVKKAKERNENISFKEGDKVTIIGSQRQLHFSSRPIIYGIVRGSMTFMGSSTPFYYMINWYNHKGIKIYSDTLYKTLLEAYKP